MDGKPMYEKGYEFLFRNRQWRVTEVTPDTHYSDRYVYFAVTDGVNECPFDAEEMTASVASNVAAETDRLIAQLNALHGQTKRVVALTGEERVLLRSLLLYYCGNAATDTLRHDGEALYDKLAGAEAGE